MPKNCNLLAQKLKKELLGLKDKPVKRVKEDKTKI